MFRGEIKEGNGMDITVLGRECVRYHVNLEVEKETGHLYKHSRGDE